jgi:nicotinamidase-related amidase
VQGTPGAALLPELDLVRVDHIVEKGLDPRVEMYSAFYDPLSAPRVCDSGLAPMLRAAGVSHVFVVGLAADYCVRSTAVDAAAEGFRTCIVREGTRAVDDKDWEEWEQKLGSLGVSVVSVDGEEVERVVKSARPR